MSIFSDAAAWGNRVMQWADNQFGNQYWKPSSPNKVNFSFSGSCGTVYHCTVALNVSKSRAMVGLSIRF